MSKIKNKKIGIIDYELSNLGAIKSAVKKLNYEYKLIKEPKYLSSVEKIILPGVGSFKTAVENLLKSDLFYAIKDEVLEKKKPILGICLGMQLLSSTGYEGGESEGLNLIPGEVRYMDYVIKKKLALPHVGWNKIQFKKKSKLFDHILNDEYFYFIHSFNFIPDNKKDIVATTKYGREFVSVLQRENIYGIQPHPEKSQLYGLKFLDNFLKIKC